MCSSSKSVGTGSTSRPGSSNICHTTNPNLQSSKANRPPDIWESILCEDPNNPSAIRMILRRVRCSDSSHKSGFCPQSSQQASLSPDLPQSAVQHVEGRASEAAGLNRLRKRKQGETSSDLMDLKMSPPVSKRACLTVRTEWVLKIRSLFRERQRQRQGYSHTSFQNSTTDKLKMSMLNGSSGLQDKYSRMQKFGHP